MMRWRALMLVGLAALAGCSDILTDQYDYGTFEIRAVRRSGEPVGGVRLTMYTGTRHLGYGVTDSTGTFLFRFVPGVTLGVLAEPPDAYRPVDLATGYTVTTDFEEGRHASWEFRYLKYGEGSAAVEVLEEDGRPIPGVRLQVYSPSGVVAEAVTDQAGKHEFGDLPLGEYGVFAFPKPAYSLLDGAPIGVVENLLIDEGHREEVTFTFRACRGAIRVRAADPAGEGILGLGVRVYDPAGILAEGVTGSDGDVAFSALFCGAYGILLSAPPGAVPVGPAAAGFVDGIRVEQGGTTEVGLSYTRCSGSVFVRVVDQFDLPVADARLVLYTPFGNVREVRTGPSGTFHIQNVPCHDQHGVFVDPPEGFSVGEGRGEEFFDGLRVTSTSVPDVTFRVRRL